MSTSTTSDIELTVTPDAAVEVKKFMEAEGVTGDQGGLRVSVQPGGCSGFKYRLVIEDKSAEDDFVLDERRLQGFRRPVLRSVHLAESRSTMSRRCRARASRSRIQTPLAVAAAVARSPHKLASPIVTLHRGW